MKRFLLTLAVSLTALLPFSLKAEETEQPACIHGEFQVSDVSVALGNEVFAEYMYQFLNRFADLLADMDEHAKQLITLFPGEPVTLSWEKDMEELRNVLANRESNIKLLTFLGAGIYPDNFYEDDATREEFHALQNLIFTGLIKSMEILNDYDEEKISEQDYEERLAEVEEKIMEKTKSLCLRSEDSFFTDDISEFFGDASTRLEALGRLLPLDDEDEFDGDSKAEMAFDDLEETMVAQLDELVHEMFSIEAVEQLCLQMMNGVEASVACESLPPELQEHS